MRRREKSPDHEVPADLLTYDPATWRHRGGVEAWSRARSAWCREHDGVWPSGDVVDMLRESVAVKRRLAIEAGLHDRAN